MTLEQSSADNIEFDTLVVPAHPKGFEEVYLEKRMWPNVKVDRKKIEQLQYLAVYQTRPISAITHFATVGKFELLEKKGRYNLFFNEEPTEISHVKFTKFDLCAVQGPRYTTLKRLLAAQSISHAFPA